MKMQGKETIELGRNVENLSYTCAIRPTYDTDRRERRLDNVVSPSLYLVCETKQAGQSSFGHTMHEGSQYPWHEVAGGRRRKATKGFISVCHLQRKNKGETGSRQSVRAH